MKKKDMVDKTQVTERHFYCYSCGIYWKTSDWEEAGAASEHKELSNNCLSKCPECGKDTLNVPWYYANLEKMSENATGPRTVEGKARSSMNSFKTGISARKHHMLAPALHGKYAECEACEDAERCENKELKHCPTNTSLLLKFIQAYESGTIQDTRQIAGLMQGQLKMILQLCMADIIDKGPTVLSTHKEYEEWKAHPNIKNLKPLMEAAGVTAEQQKMTPRQEEGDNDFRGNLNLMTDAADFIETLKNMALNSNKKMKDAEQKLAEDDVNKNIDEEETGGKANVKLPEKNIFE